MSLSNNHVFAGIVVGVFVLAVVVGVVIVVDDALSSSVFVLLYQLVRIVILFVLCY